MDAQNEGVEVQNGAVEGLLTMQWSEIRITLMRIRIRIRIKVKSRIRIRIKVKRGVCI
jgi:hypothetical protein